MRRDLYYKKEVRREFENFGNLWHKLSAFGQEMSQKTKQEVSHKSTKSRDTIIKTKAVKILPYVPKLSEKLKLILLRHGIQTVFKAPQKLDGLLSLLKDAMEPGYRQGAIYKVNCSDCDQCYIGKTKC